LIFGFGLLCVSHLLLFYFIFIHFLFISFYLFSSFLCCVFIICIHLMLSHFSRVGVPSYAQFHSRIVLATGRHLLPLQVNRCLTTRKMSEDAPHMGEKPGATEQAVCFTQFTIVIHSIA
jgi:hypothetical protein